MPVNNPKSTNSKEWRKITTLWALSFLETLALILFFVLTGSKSEEHWLFNLSKIRAVGVAVLLIVAGVFLWQAVRAIQQYRRNLLFDSSTDIWLLNFFSPFALPALMIIVVFFIDRQLLFYEKWKPFYSYLQPVMSWLAVLSVQTVLITFLIDRPSNSQSQNLPDQKWKKILSREIGLVFVLFAALVGLKMLFVLPIAAGPRIHGDENTYFTMAWKFFTGNFPIGDMHHYPPMYPLLISPAFLFHPLKTYETIKFLNTLYSSSIIFPLYLIARRFLNPKQSFVVLFVTVINPYHLIEPQLMMSENVYVPLFLWASYLFTQVPSSPNRLKMDFLCGVVIGLTWLTRYITFVVFPAFLICWWIKPFNGEVKILKPNRSKVIHFFALSASAVMIFGFWVLCGIMQGVSLKEMVGFGITQKTNPEQLTLQNLLMWIEFYAAYIILIAAPLLLLLIYGIRSVEWKRLDQEFPRWMVSLLLLLGSFLLAVIRHSWRAIYNYPYPWKLMGRYLIVFTPLLLITGLIILIGFENQKRLSRNNVVLTGVLSFFFSVLAFILLSEKLSPYPYIPDWTSKRGSLDGAYIDILQPAYILLVFLLVVVSVFSFIRRYRYVWKVSFIVGLACYYLLGLPLYTKIYYDEFDFQLIGRQIAEKLYQIEPVLHDQKVIIHLSDTIQDDEEGRLADAVEMSFLVSLIPNTSTYYGKVGSDQLKDAAYLITMEDSAADARDVDSLAELNWFWKGEDYIWTIQKLPKPQD